MIDDSSRAGADNPIDALYDYRYQKIYGRGLIGQMSKIVHRSMEIPFGKNDFFGRTIELGAGSGQHLSFVRHGFSEYFETDIRPQYLPIRGVSTGAPKVFQFKQDAMSLSNFDDGHFDRLVATCLLAHMDDPGVAIAEWIRVVRPKGFLTIYLPLDSAMLVRLFQKVFVAPAARRAGVDYFKTHQLEHRYHFEFLREIVRSSAANSSMTVRFYPFVFSAQQMNLWAIVHIQKN